MIKVITNSFIKIYCEKMYRAFKGKKCFTRCFTKKKITNNTCLLSNHICDCFPAKIRAQLKFSCFGTFTHNTADLNKIKDSFSLSH